MLAASTNPDVPVLSVIIVSYNTRALLLRCLATLEPELAGIPSEVFVVDNASKDGSPAAVHAAFPKVRVLGQEQNLGFGAANNVALRESRGELILLLNSDAFVHPGALSAMRDCLARNPAVGVVGPRLVNEDGSLQRSCWRFPSPFRSWLESLWISGAFPHHPFLGDYRDWSHDTERVVEFVIGACIMVRREVYEKVGGFDESFFLYAEETDWQRRITDAGWKVMLCPGAVVTHLAGASGRVESAKVNRHFWDGFDRYHLKYHGRMGLLSVRVALLVGCFGRLILWFGAALVPSMKARASGQIRKQIGIAGRQFHAGVQG
jgi:GT2 family glycosyltransferase